MFAEQDKASWGLNLGNTTGDIALRKSSQHDALNLSYMYKKASLPHIHVRRNTSIHLIGYFDIAQNMQGFPPS